MCLIWRPAVGPIHLDYLKGVLILLQCLLFFLVFWAGVQPVRAAVELPDITRAVELKMHTGTAEEALAFIEQRQTQCQDLTEQAKILLQRAESSPAQEGKP